MCSLILAICGGGGGFRTPELFSTNIDLFFTLAPIIDQFIVVHAEESFLGYPKHIPSYSYFPKQENCLKFGR